MSTFHWYLLGSFSLSLSFSLTVHYCALFWPFLHSIILRCGRVKSGLNLSLTSCWRTNSSCMLFSFRITLSEGTFSLFLFPNLAQHLVFIPYPFYCVTLFGIVSTFLNFFPFLLFIYLFFPPKVKKRKRKRKRKEEEEAEFTVFYRDLDPWIFVVFKWAFGIVSGFDVLGKFCHWSNKVSAEINFCFLF